MTNLGLQWLERGLWNILGEKRKPSTPDGSLDTLKTFGTVIELRQSTPEQFLDIARPRCADAANHITVLLQELISPEKSRIYSKEKPTREEAGADKSSFVKDAAQRATRWRRCLL